MGKGRGGRGQALTGESFTPATLPLRRHPLQGVFHHHPRPSTPYPTPRPQKERALLGFFSLGSDRTLPVLLAPYLHTRFPLLCRSHMITVWSAGPISKYLLDLDAILCPQPLLSGQHLELRVPSWRTEGGPVMLDSLRVMPFGSPPLASTLSKLQSAVKNKMGEKPAFQTYIFLSGAELGH